MADLIAALVAHAWLIGTVVTAVLVLGGVVYVVADKPARTDDQSGAWPLDLLLDSMARPEHDTDWTMS